MNFRLDAGDTVPQEVRVVGRFPRSFVVALEVLRSNGRGLSFLNTMQFDEKSLKLLPKAFELNATIESLKFKNMQLNLVAEVMCAGFRRDNIRYIEFAGYGKMNNPESLETICQAFKERSEPFHMVLKECSSEFVKCIIEASYRKCFSLHIRRMGCSELQCLFKKAFFRGNLFYMCLAGVTGLKEDFFLQLARVISMIPRLGRLDLTSTIVPSLALKRLYGSMKMILGPERSNIFQKFDPGLTPMEDKLAFGYSRFLHCDLFDEFSLNVKEDVSRAVVKNISSTVAKTKNLKRLYTGNYFSSGTKFNNFNLQTSFFVFFSPFGVNPTVP